jgi:23S rRNA pseudouridine1911/1915/1917 synthase
MLELNQIVPEECHLFRADVILAKLYPTYSRNQWIDWLRQGLVSIENRPITPKEKLKTGDHLVGKIPVSEKVTTDLPQDIALDIVYEDAYLLVINKPQGLVVHPGAGQSDNTLLNALLHHNNDLNILPRAGIVHRLDKDTTGLLVVAKTQECYQKLVQKMQERQIHRAYFALVHGNLIGEKRIETTFGRDPKNRLKMAVRPIGKLAVTHCKVLQNFSQNTLVRVQLETGRTHQIRVHLTHIGHPIVGDKLYGKARAPGKGLVPEALNTFPRQALHAQFLSFNHPITEKPLTFSADIPDDFALLLQFIEANG